MSNDRAAARGKSHKREAVTFAHFHLSTVGQINQKNLDESAGPLARPFARLLAPLSRLLAPHYSLRLRAPLRSFTRSLRSFPRPWESE